MRYSASENSVTLKTGLGIVQGHWKRCRSIDHIWHMTFYWSAIVNIALYLVPFLSYLTLNYIVTLKSRLEVIQSHSQNGTIWKLWCGLLFSFQSNYGSILHQFRDIARYNGRKSGLFHTPLHSTPPLGGSRRNIATPFGMEKLEWCGYPTVKKFRRYVYSFWHDPRTWQTDRRTDRQTPHDGKDRAYA